MPGSNPLSAELDVSRATVRRAERRTVAYIRESSIADSLAPQYLNRLADYLYILTRASETDWVPSRRKEAE